MLERSYQEFLRGRWSVHRDVVDRKAQLTGVFTGHAQFADGDDPGTLHYVEDGELSFGAHRGPATRQLVYRARPDGALDVRFLDGRDFYVLDLRDRQWDAGHLCKDDLYTVTGQVTGPDSFTERWHAAGPAKDYDLITDYRRITAGPPPSA
ncbi:DUF6314 family protein [Actinoplanes sp. TFC3]|uniref:DUF6314 family protein n=1 Tax=Actinoplanes sp. TFC3 TaxID=1710355 RepID=UPI00082F90FE|nr:DUF6314 family protein [Actinoplanes sp. TFC3]